MIPQDVDKIFGKFNLTCEWVRMTDDERREAFIKLREDKEKLREALDMLYRLCNFGTSEGAFRNGVTNATGDIDEGEVTAGKWLGHAERVLEETK